MCQHDHSQVPGAEEIAALSATLLASRDFADRSESPEALIIEGGTLIDPETGHAIEDGVVVLARGRVVAVGTRDETAAAIAEHGAAATRLQAHGKFVLPGFVDAHLHASDFEGVSLALHNGATSLRSGSSTFFQDIAISRIPHYTPGLVPRVLPAGIFVSPEQEAVFLADPALAPLAALRDRITKPEDLAYITRVNLARGAKVIKTRANPRAGLPETDPRELAFDEEQISAVVRAAAEQGAEVLCHAYSAEGIAGAVAAGVRSIEHGVFVSEETLAEMARKGTHFTPTLFTLTNMADAPNPILAARGHEYIPVLTEAIRTAHEMGVTVVGGTDSSGGSHFYPIGAEGDAIGRAGLGELKALRSITTDSAKLLRIFDQGAGQLIAGGFADVVVLGSNPLESSAALLDVRAVVAQGVVVRDELAQ